MYNPTSESNEDDSLFSAHGGADPVGARDWCQVIGGDDIIAGIPLDGTERLPVREGGNCGTKS